MLYNDIIMPHSDIKMSFLDKKTPQSDILPYPDLTMLYSHIKITDRDIIMPHPSIMRPHCRLLVLLYNSVVIMQHYDN